MDPLSTGFGVIIVAAGSVRSARRQAIAKSHWHELNASLEACLGVSKKLVGTKEKKKKMTPKRSCESLPFYDMIRQFQWTN